MAISEKNLDTYTYGADHRDVPRHRPAIRGINERTVLTFLSAAASAALLLATMFFVIVGFFKAAIIAFAVAAAFGFTVWFFDTEEERRLW